MSYYQNLTDTKSLYPFARWREAYDDGLEQYTSENCDLTKEVFDILISQLISLGESVPAAKKINCFKHAIITLNNLNEEIEGLIETGEREDLCELIDKITIATGLNPSDYGDGEGIADEWRDW